MLSESLPALLGGDRQDLTEIEAMDEERSRLLRPRVVIYPLILAVVLGLFGLTLAGKGTAESRC